MRAATTLVPLLQSAGAVPHLWRGDEWVPADQRSDCIPSGFQALDPELPGRGWPRGQLIELLVDHPGIGELGLLLPALAAVTRSGRTCVWVLPCQANRGDGAHTAPHAAQAACGQQAVVPHVLPYAPALVEAGIDLARNIFVRPLSARESGWALEQSLRASHLGALIGWMPEGGSSDADFRSLRRLHLLAQRHQALVFVLRTSHHARAPSPAALRMHLQHDGSQLQLRLLKRRGRPLLEPVAIQVHPARWNQAAMPVPATASTSPVPPASSPSLLPIMRALRPDTAWPLRPLFSH